MCEQAHFQTNQHSQKLHLFWRVSLFPVVCLCFVVIFSFATPIMHLVCFGWNVLKHLPIERGSKVTVWPVLCPLAGLGFPDTHSFLVSYLYRWHVVDRLWVVDSNTRHKMKSVNCRVLCGHKVLSSNSSIPRCPAVFGPVALCHWETGKR